MTRDDGARIPVGVVPAGTGIAALIHNQSVIKSVRQVGWSKTDCKLSVRAFFCR